MSTQDILPTYRNIIMQRNVRASHLNVKNEVESVSHAYGLDEFSHFRVKIRHFMADYSHLQTTPQRVGGQKYMFKGVMGVAWVDTNTVRAALGPQGLPWQWLSDTRRPCMDNVPVAA
jgi:hypothetical protein